MDGSRLAAASTARSTTGPSSLSPSSSSGRPTEAPQAPPVVVASLPKRAPHPYSALSLSPTKQHAVTACNDTLQIVAINPDTGLHIVHTIPFAPHFAKATIVREGSGGGGNAVSGGGILSGHTGSSSNPLAHVSTSSLFRAPLNLTTGTTPLTSSTFHATSTGGKSAFAAPSNTMMNVVVNDVAWSNDLAEIVAPTSSSGASTSSSSSTVAVSSGKQSFIAASGSNGAIAVWRAKALLKKGKSVVPEVALNQHVQAVNRLAWHPKRQMLLSASQDTTVRLWERRRSRSRPSDSKTSSSHSAFNFGKFVVGGFQAAARGSGVSGEGGSDGDDDDDDEANEHNYTWLCVGAFEPRCEAVRDIAWNPHQDDMFALCTSSGSLQVYNRLVRAKCMIKLVAHDRDATTLQWHPTRLFVIATGGSNDRLVKVWNLAPSLAGMVGVAAATGGATTATGDATAATPSYNVFQNQFSISADSMQSTAENSEAAHTNDSSSHSLGSKASQAILTFGSGNHNTLVRQPPEHVLAVAASVKRVQWRPPSVVSESGGSVEDTSNHGGSAAGSNSESSYAVTAPEYDWHESMLAVATAPVKGENWGGAGLIALWSYHRPHMPLSVVEGHKEGSVVDLAWLETPPAPHSQKSSSRTGGMPSAGPLSPSRRLRSPKSIQSDPVDYGKSPERSMTVSAERASPGSIFITTRNTAIWQHVISVGKDGRCLIQSLVRGDRPIARVPPSCFAMANLSPFQRGYGSLQIFSVSQDVGGGGSDDFWLTALRQDDITAAAPEIFREAAPVEEEQVAKGNPKPLRHRLPPKSPCITFNVIDQGDLDEVGKPSEENEEEPVMVVAPEVVHLSRFADLYALYPTTELPTRVHLCLHNSRVAKSLLYDSLAHMWQMIAALLQHAGVDSFASLHTADGTGFSGNSIIHFAVVPTIRSVLEERADEGDVQTCVALCEILQVVNTDQSTQIPGLEIELVREWYLSYIDLLRDMCLFSHASSVIRNCSDPLVSSQNKHSTTIYESCPYCAKPMLQDGNGSVARRFCKSCEHQVGLCFLCHEPVKGMFVWCPGCGHGGHLEHALSWFGGLGGTDDSVGSTTVKIREVCPTGCGHRCNMLQTLNAFPRTESLRREGSAGHNGYVDPP